MQLPNESPFGLLADSAEPFSRRLQVQGTAARGTSSVTPHNVDNGTCHFVFSSSNKKLEILSIYFRANERQKYLMPFCC